MKTSRSISAAMSLAALCLLISAKAVQAQDVVKVASDSHTVLLENDQVRVMDVHIKPGGKVAMHSHPANVTYYMTDGKVKITAPDGKTQEREVKAGTSAWNEPTTHMVENLGSEFHELQIEMKQADKTTPAKK